jgi:hypothetical protein
MGTPERGWRTFTRSDFIRVPFPAARMTLIIPSNPQPFLREIYYFILRLMLFRQPSIKYSPLLWEGRKGRGKRLYGALTLTPAYPAMGGIGHVPAKAKDSAPILFYPFFTVLIIQ